jgi:thiol-disulfide isomerase/thioredoxin
MMFKLVTCFMLFCNIAAEVIVLTDKTFEHQTQASTGQTTGKWLIMFSAPWCGRTCAEMIPTLELLEKSVGDGSVLVATVNTLENLELADRFGILSQPTLVFFADRKMYKYRGLKTLEAIQQFVEGGYKDAVALPVPAPPSFFDLTKRKIERLFDENKELRFLREDFQHIVAVRKNAAVILMILGAILGMFMTCTLSCLFSSKKGKVKQS